MVNPENCDAPTGAQLRRGLGHSVTKNGYAAATPGCSYLVHLLSNTYDDNRLRYSLDVCARSTRVPKSHEATIVFFEAKNHEIYDT